MITVTTCEVCNHSDLDHDRGTYCSNGWCMCTLTPSAVRNAGTPRDVPTTPGYDHATGRWVDEQPRVWA